MKTKITEPIKINQPNNHYGNDHEGYEQDVKRRERDHKMAELIGALPLGEPKPFDTKKLSERVTEVYGVES
jgi:hypothetical protein